MGNYLSKKCCCCLTSRLNNSIFSSYKLIFEDKDAYNEKEHSGHILLREIFKGNFCSPIRDILFDPNTKVLDVGCGSGFWLMEMAADFQKPQYFGVDMFTIFPQSTYPNNIEFLRHNFLEGLPYEDNSFDFIHMQFLVCDFTESQWETFVYQELARVLKPGGWLEICDPEIEFINGGPITKKLNIAVRNNLLSKNFNPYMIQRHRLLINSIPSFSSSTVHHEKGYFPLSSHSSKIGELGGLHITENCKGILQGPVGRDMKIKKRHINSTIEKIALEFDTYSTYINIHRFYAQKG